MHFVLHQLNRANNRSAAPETKSHKFPEVLES